MKTMKRLFCVLLTAMVIGCAEHVESTDKSNTSQTAATPGTVEFDAYQQRSTTRSGWGGVLDKTQLMETEANGGGFGVFAYYTDLRDYDQTYVPNFMYNQGVFWNGADGSGTANIWEYSPLMYWPNEYGYDAASDDEDKLSFFAYAPYVPSKSAAGGTVEDATYGIVGFSRNNATGDPVVRYIASFDPNESVDLCWGVCDQTSWSKIQGGSTQTMTAGLPWLNVQRPLETASQQAATTSRIKFKFNHALAQLNVQIDADVDVTTHQDGTDPDVLDAATKVYVRSISFTGVALKGALNLNNTTPNEALWLDWCGCTDLSYGQSVTILDGRRDSREGVSGAEAANETPQGLNSAIVQNSYTTLGVTNKLQNLFEPYATHAPAVTGQPTDAEITAGLQDAVMVIPTGEAMTVTIVYDIETANPKLASYLSDGVTHGVSIENKVTQTVSFGGVYGAGLESNKRYTLKLHLGMNSVKFDADVSDWASSTVDGDAWLPSNTRPILLNHSLMYIAQNTTLTATTDPVGQTIYWTNDDGDVATMLSVAPSPAPRRAQENLTTAMTTITLEPQQTGTTKVTAKLASNDKAECTVIVVPVTLTADDTTTPASSVTTPSKTIAVAANKDDAITLTAQWMNTSGSATVSWNISPSGDLTVTDNGDGTYSIDCTKEGTYTITCTNSAYGSGSGGDDDATCTLTVTAQTPTYTPPTANTLTYNGTSGDNGTAQALVTGGSVTGGTGAEMQYAIGTSSAPTGSYSTTIPTQTDAGTYYVWYKVVGGTGYDDISDLGPVAVTIAKKTPTVTLSATSGTGYAKGVPSTFTATTDGASSLTVSSTNGTASISSGTVTAQGATSGTATITVSSAASTNYNAASETYTLTVNAKNLNMNPLSYVTQYNVTGSTPAMGTQDSDNYFYNYSTANGISISGYHVPSREEWMSIVPADWTASQESVIGGGTSLYAAGSSHSKTVKFNLNSTTQAGITDNSYWIGSATSDGSGHAVRYAIRYIGTEYCSVWKYELTGTNGTDNSYRLEVSSALIDYCKDATEAASWYSANSGTLSSLFSGTLGSTNKFFARGYANGTAASAAGGPGVLGDYWSSSPDGSNGWHLGFGSGLATVNSVIQTYGYSVRLFRD